MSCCVVLIGGFLRDALASSRSFVIAGLFVILAASRFYGSLNNTPLMRMSDTVKNEQNDVLIVKLAVALDQNSVT